MWKDKAVEPCYRQNVFMAFRDPDRAGNRDKHSVPHSHGNDRDYGLPDFANGEKIFEFGAAGFPSSTLLETLCLIIALASENRMIGRESR
jgi:hypothetical protein